MLTNSLDVKLELETPVFDKRIYTSSLSKEELIKHKSYKSKDLKRSQVSCKDGIVLITKI